jgi:hypothetical protein
MNFLSNAGISRRDAVTGLLAGAALAVPSGGLLVAETRIAAASNLEKGHKLAPALKMAREAESTFRKIEDYTATFHKDEVVGNRRIRQEMKIKVSEDAFSVYLKFLKPDAGREVIYVAGKNNGNLLTHGTGLEAVVGTLELDPKGSLAMKDSRHPVTSIGMRKMVQKIMVQWEAELTISGIKVSFFPNAKIGSLECRVVQTTHAKQQKGARFHMTRLYVAKKTGLPIRVEQFAFPRRTGAKPIMLEQYTYLDIKTNAGLKSIDFATSNPKYGY